MLLIKCEFKNVNRKTVGQYKSWEKINKHTNILKTLYDYY